MSQSQEDQLQRVVDDAIEQFNNTITANYPQAAAHLPDEKNVENQTKFADSVKGAIRMSLWLQGQ